MWMDAHTGLQAPLAPDELRHESKVVGALPIINHFRLLLGLDGRLQRFLPGADPRSLLPPAVGLGVLLRNRLVSREPLYNQQEWGRRSEECLHQVKREHHGLNCREISFATCGM